MSLVGQTLQIDNINIIVHCNKSSLKHSSVDPENAVVFLFFSSSSSVSE